MAVVWGQGGRSYVRVPCHARTTTPRMPWVEGGRPRRALASLGPVSSRPLVESLWNALFAPVLPPDLPRNWLTGIVVLRRQS